MVKILPTIGNNDVEYYYQVPTIDRKEIFYGTLFDIYFTEVPANAAYPRLDDIKTTFLKGGYYRYDLSDTLSVISLNTLYFTKKNQVDLAQGDE